MLDARRVERSSRWLSEEHPATSPTADATATALAKYPHRFNFDETRRCPAASRIGTSRASTSDSERPEITAQKADCGRQVSEVVTKNAGSLHHIRSPITHISRSYSAANRTHR